MTPAYDANRARHGRRAAGGGLKRIQPFQVNGNFTCFQNPSGT